MLFGMLPPGIEKGTFYPASEVSPDVFEINFRKGFTLKVHPEKAMCGTKKGIAKGEGDG